MSYVYLALYHKSHGWRYGGLLCKNSLLNDSLTLWNYIIVFIGPYDRIKFLNGISSLEDLKIEPLQNNKRQIETLKITRYAIDPIADWNNTNLVVFFKFDYNLN